MKNSLSSVKTGSKCIATTHEFTYRLNGMGIRIGKEIEVVRATAENGPVHIKVGDTELILRSVDAACIYVDV